MSSSSSVQSMFFSESVLLLFDLLEGLLNLWFNFALLILFNFHSLHLNEKVFLSLELL